MSRGDGGKEHKSKADSVRPKDASGQANGSDLASKSCGTPEAGTQPEQQTGERAAGGVSVMKAERQGDKAKARPDVCSTTTVSSPSYDRELLE